MVFAQTDWEGYGNGSRKPDAEFIAAARTLVQELVDAVEQQQADDMALAIKLIQTAVWMKRQYQDAGLCVARAFCAAKGFDADDLERGVRLRGEAPR